MIDHEELLSAAAADLPGAGGLTGAFGAAASAFEAIRLAAETHADTDIELFAAWMLTAAEAADGRDAMLHAASSRSAPLILAQPLTPEQVADLARALADLLRAAVSHVSDPVDAAACERAAACAGRVHDLLAGDTT